MVSCSDMKCFVAEKTHTFCKFVSASLRKKGIIQALNALLPFDHLVKASLMFVNDDVKVKSMGIALMRIDMEPAIFSFGISIEVDGSDINHAIESTEFLVACMTLEQLQAYVDTIEFTKSITEFFENEIDRSYYKQQTEES